MTFTIQTQFTHFEYHWLWGLQYHKQPSIHNIKPALEAYLQNPVLLSDHIDNIFAIQQKPSWLRGLFWLFNIRNYAKHSQTLALLYIEATRQNDESILQFFTPLQGSIFMETAQRYFRSFQERLPRFNFDWPTAGSFNPINHCYPQQKPDQEQGFIELQSQNNAETMARFALNDENGLPSSEEKEVSDIFIITPALLSHINTLKIQGIKIGHSLSIKDVRQAYKKQALLSHPDKVPGRQAQFIAIKSAYESIEAILTKNTDAQSHLFASAFAKWDEELEFIKQGIEKLNQGVTRLQQNQAALAKEQMIAKQEQEKIRHDQDCMQESLNDMDHRLGDMDHRLGDMDHRLGDMDRKFKESRKDCDEFWGLLEQYQTSAPAEKATKSPQSYLAPNSKTEMMQKLHQELFAQTTLKQQAIASRRCEVFSNKQHIGIREDNVEEHMSDSDENHSVWYWSHNNDLK